MNKTLVWEDDGYLSSVMHVAGWLHVKVFRPHEYYEGWLWYIDGFPKVGVDTEGKSGTMERAKVDAIGALKEATIALLLRVESAQQNTPGFLPPEKQT